MTEKDKQQEFRIQAGSEVEKDVELWGPIAYRPSQKRKGGPRFGRI